MNIILAQLRKDIVTFRLLLWIWGIGVILGCLGFLSGIPIFHGLMEHGLINEPHHSLVSGTEQADSVSPQLIPEIMLGFGAIFAIIMMVCLFNQVLLVVLTVQVIHADPLTEPDAFWRTRPIPRRLLFAEKALFVALLFAGTVLVALSTKTRVGDASEADMLRQGVVFMSGLVAFAAVTRNFSKLLLTFFGFAFGARIVSALLLIPEHVATSEPMGRYGLYVNEHLHFLSHAGPLLMPGLYLAGFLSVIVHQYFTLRTNISRSVLFTTFVVLSVLQNA